MKNTKTSLSLLRMAVVAMLSVAMVSCGGEAKKAEDTAGELDKAKSDVAQQVEKVIAELPPPSELPYQLEATGAEFDESLPNSLDKADNYLTSDYASALNLGIYAADIGYLASYEEVQPALNYMQAARALASNLNLTSILDEALISRFEANLGSKDSLAAIVNEVIQDADEALKRSQREKTAALMLAGTFIEGLYLSTAIIENFPKDMLPEQARQSLLVPVVKIVVDEEKTLGDLIVLLDTYKDDEQVASLIGQLKELQAAYTSLHVQEQIQNDRGDLLLKDTTLDQITNKTGEIRDAITG